MQREPIFHRPESGMTRQQFELMTADDYWEIGASGQRYEREQIWAVLEQRYAETAINDPARWHTSDFHLSEIAPATYLLTYTLLQEPNRLSRRLTVWQHRDISWIALYHQGTLVSGQR